MGTRYSSLRRVGAWSRLAAALSYSGGLLTAMVFLVAERRDGFVRFHATQSALVLGAGWLVGAALWAASLASTLEVSASAARLAAAAALTWRVLLGLTVAGMVVALAGRRWALPGVGRVANAVAGRARR